MNTEAKISQFLDNNPKYSKDMGLRTSKQASSTYKKIMAYWKPEMGIAHKLHENGISAPSNFSTVKKQYTNAQNKLKQLKPNEFFDEDNVNGNGKKPVQMHLEDFKLRVLAFKTHDKKVNQFLKSLSQNQAPKEDKTMDKNTQQSSQGFDPSSVIMKGSKRVYAQTPFDSPKSQAPSQSATQQSQSQSPFQTNTATQSNTQIQTNQQASQSTSNNSNHKKPKYKLTFPQYLSKNPSYAKKMGLYNTAQAKAFLNQSIPKYKKAIANVQDPKQRQQFKEGLSIRNSQMKSLQSGKIYSKYAMYSTYRSLKPMSRKTVSKRIRAVKRRDRQGGSRSKQNQSKTRSVNRTNQSQSTVTQTKDNQKRGNEMSSTQIARYSNVHVNILQNKMEKSLENGKMPSKKLTYASRDWMRASRYASAHPKVTASPSYVKSGNFAKRVSYQSYKRYKARQQGQTQSKGQKPQKNYSQMIAQGGKRNQQTKNKMKAYSYKSKNDYKKRRQAVTGQARHNQSQRHSQNRAPSHDSGWIR